MNLNLKRVFAFAVADFYRHKGIAISAIFVLTLTILLATALFFVHGISRHLTATIQNKIDVTAYFKENTDEEMILAARQEILNNVSNIRSVVYVSKEDALNDFLAKHQGDKAILQAVNEVGENPFLPSLNIVTTGNSMQYEAVANVLEGQEFSEIIERVDFSEKKATIEKIFSITSSINTMGLILGVILVLIAILVVFNTVKLIIDHSKDEISTMKIVGASKWFIKTPFIIEGGIFGLVSLITAIIITMLTVYSSSYFLSVIMPGFSLLKYFLSNFLIVIAIQLIFGVGLGVLSSYIVVRRYLEI